MSSPVCFNAISCAMASYYTSSLWPTIGAPLMAHAAIGAHYSQKLMSAAYEQMQNIALVWHALDPQVQNASVAAGVLFSALILSQLFLYIVPGYEAMADVKTQPPLIVVPRRSTRMSKAPERYLPPAAPKRKRKATTPKGGRAVELTCGSRYIYHIVWSAEGQPIMNKAFYNARTGFVEPDNAGQMSLQSFVRQHTDPSVKPVKQFDNMYVKTRAAMVPLVSFKV